LENFLIDAEECWRQAGDQRAHSGPWIEQRADGEQVEIEATALTTRGFPILIIKRLGAEFEAKKEVLQKARETVIAHQRLNSEIQKKEILLHCVADEMTATLANIVTSLRLIEGETDQTRAKVMLGLAMRGTDEQQRLINRILDVFADEIGSISGRDGREEEAADWDSLLQDAIAATKPAYSKKNVRLVQRTPATSALQVTAGRANLTRVVENLLENALERTPAGGEVEVACEAEAEWLLCRFIDCGPLMLTDESETAFSKFHLPAAGSSAAIMRLHFCRIMIESHGGEIGCGVAETGGTSFWFRLPRSAAS
jgi:signal transduction histidine kinase